LAFVQPVATLGGSSLPKAASFGSVSSPSSTSGSENIPRYPSSAAWATSRLSA